MRTQNANDGSMASSWDLVPRLEIFVILGPGPKIKPFGVILGLFSEEVPRLRKSGNLGTWSQGDAFYWGSNLGTTKKRRNILKKDKNALRASLVGNSRSLLSL